VVYGRRCSGDKSVVQLRDAAEPGRPRCLGEARGDGDSERDMSQRDRRHCADCGRTRGGLADGLPPRPNATRNLPPNSV
jgi:hypothetical protein